MTDLLKNFNNYAYKMIMGSKTLLFKINLKILNVYQIDKQ